LGALRLLPLFSPVAYNGPRRETRMSQRPPDTLEVQVSFEVNRLASVYLTNAYELLIPTVPERKPAATVSTLAASLPLQTPERKTV
jgi:hypothetical protein